MRSKPFDHLLLSDIVITRCYSFFCFLVLMLLSTSCSVQEKILNFGPINGFLTFQQAHFATADDVATVIFIINCYNAVAKNDSTEEITAYQIANKTVEELNDIAAKVQIPTYQMTLLTDSTVSAMITTTDYNQISAFIDHIRNRLGEMSTTYNVKSNVPEFKLVFTHAHNHNEVLFRYSRFLFAENSAIIFESQSGNVRYSPKTNSETLRLQTVTYHEVDYLANKYPLNKNNLNAIELVRFSCNQKEKSWWEKLFSSDADDSVPKVIEPLKHPPNALREDKSQNESVFSKFTAFVGNWLERPINLLASIVSIGLGIVTFKQITRN